MARTRRARDEPPECHPDRPHQAKGLCPQCYMKDYDARRKGRPDRRKDPQDYSPYFRKPPSKPQRNADCHPDRTHHSRGLCSPCYQRALRDGALPTERSVCHPERPAVAGGLCHSCYAKNRYWDNPQKYREAERERQAATRKRIRDELIEAYGGRCVCDRCPETNPAFLTLDHVNGDGNHHRKELGSHTYMDLKRRRWPKEGYRLLCWNCNAMTRGGKPCPHEAE